MKLSDSGISYKGVKKIIMKFFDKRGLLSMSGDFTLKRGTKWEIPKDPVNMKAFFIEKFERDMTWVEKDGGSISFQFGYYCGTSGCIIFRRDLSKRKTRLRESE